jgi:hypothetical protein
VHRDGPGDYGTEATLIGGRQGGGNPPAAQAQNSCLTIPDAAPEQANRIPTKSPDLPHLNLPGATPPAGPYCNNGNGTGRNKLHDLTTANEMARMTRHGLGGPSVHFSRRPRLKSLFLYRGTSTGGTYFTVPDSGILTTIQGLCRGLEHGETGAMGTKTRQRAASPRPFQVSAFHRPYSPSLHPSHIPERACKRQGRRAQDRVLSRKIECFGYSDDHVL